MAQGRETALAFLLGVVAGGVTALMLAPDRGSEVRRRLREGARDVYEKGGHAASGAKETVGEKAHTLADSARGQVDRLTTAARSQAHAVKGAVAEGKEAYKRELSPADDE